MSRRPRSEARAGISSRRRRRARRGPRQRDGGRKISTRRAERMRPPLRQKNLRQNNGEETKRNRKEGSAKKSKTRKLTENEPLIFAYVLALMNAKPPFQCFHFSVFNFSVNPLPASFCSLFD